MKAWTAFLAEQEKTFGIDTVKKWLRPLRVANFDACNIYLEANDSFQLHWFEEHIRPLLSSFINSNNKKIKVHLSVHKQQQTIPSKKPKTATENSLQPPPAPLRFEWDQIDPRLTLPYFISSEANAIPYKLICELTGFQQDTKKIGTPTLPLNSFNPIYLHGPSGCGKTHFLMAIANAFCQAGKKVLYVRAETFTEHVVSAIRANEMQTFRHAYRGTDILLVDDIEIFSRKGSTQEEFFHTFNSLHLEGKQIILTSQCAPSELTHIEPRLVSRFEWGIVLPLHQLQKTELRQVLHQRTTLFHYPLTEKVSDFLLDTFGTSAKVLIKALEALVLRTHLSQSEGKIASLPLSLSMVQHYLADLIKIEQQHVITPNKIIQTVAEHYGLRVDDILGKVQSRECTLPRQIAMHICRNQLKMPFMKIGDLFARDHSTVMSSVKQVDKSMAHNQEIAAAVTGIVKQLQPNHYNNKQS